MTWADVTAGRVAVVQEKTGKGLRILLHRSLGEELGRTSKRAELICVTKSGRPMTPAFAGKLLSEFTERAGYRCVPHGLRKNAVVALLEAGCPIAEVAAVSGQSLQMVEHYAKARNQVALGDAAILRWQENKS